MIREDASQIIDKTLTEVGIEFKHSYTGYALDYNCMQSQEYHEDMDGNIFSISKYSIPSFDTNACIGAFTSAISENTS